MSYDKYIDHIESADYNPKVTPSLVCACGKPVQDHPKNEDGSITGFGWRCPYLPKGFVSNREPLGNNDIDDMSDGQVEDFN